MLPARGTCREQILGSDLAITISEFPTKHPERNFQSLASVECNMAKHIVNLSLGVEQHYDEMQMECGFVSFYSIQIQGQFLRGSIRG